MKKYIILGIPFLFLFCGEVTAAADFTYVSGLEKEKFSSRPAPAKIAAESAEDLIKKGYLRIGSVSSTDTVKTCKGNKCDDFTCLDNLKHKDTTKEILKSAASHGGDLVILEEDADRDIVKTEEEKCTGTRVAGYHYEQQCSGGYGNIPRVCRDVKVLHLECESHYIVYGRKCTFTSSGTVWRFDPDFIKRIADESRERTTRAAERAKAIELAMLKYQGDPYGLAPVKIGRKWGYRDKDGNQIIQPQFDDAKAFSEGLARVTSGKKDGYIDMSGTVVIQPQFDYGGEFSGGLARVRLGKIDDDSVGYIDVNGTVVIKPQFNAAQNFSEGLAFVAQGAIGHLRWGCIDQSGKLAIGFQFDVAGVFSEGLAPAASGPAFASDRWGYISKTGEWVIRPSFFDAREFSGGLAPVAQGSLIDKKWGYIDKNGQFVIKPQFAEAWPFSEGLAAVKVDRNIGFIDQKGNFAIQPQFYDVEKFSAGLARVLVGGQWKFIDKSGKTVFDDFPDAGYRARY